MATTQTTTKTVEERFTAALAETREGGVHVALNVMTCCRSCATAKDMGLDDFDAQPFIWHFGGQGGEVALRDGGIFEVEHDDRECECYYDEDQHEYDEDDNEIVTEGEGEVECDLCRYGPRPDLFTQPTKVYFNHGGADDDLTAPQTLSKALRAQGFTVEWDGTDGQCVILVLN